MMKMFISMYPERSIIDLKMKKERLLMMNKIIVMKKAIESSRKNLGIPSEILADFCLARFRREFFPWLIPFAEIASHFAAWDSEKTAKNAWDPFLVSSALLWSLFLHCILMQHL